jgi:hypothetical protein
MNTASPSCPDPGDWQALYRAAILETDRNAIPQKVSQAEVAVLARGRQLFYDGGTGEEKESLEDALYALRAFKTACKHAGDSDASLEPAAA